MDPYPWSGSPLNFNHLFTGPLLTFPENFMQIQKYYYFMQIRYEVFVQSR